MKLDDLQIDTLEEGLKYVGVSPRTFCQFFEIGTVAELPKEAYPTALRFLDAFLIHEASLCKSS